MSYTHTETYELPTLSPPSTKAATEKKNYVSNVIHRLSQHASRGRRASCDGEDAANGGIPTPLEEPVSAAIPMEDLERWNYPNGNTYRIFATFWSFFVMGMNDAAYGALIPYLERYYNLSYTIVALIFLSPAVGYISAAFVNHAFHVRSGQRGIALVSPGVKVVAYLVMMLHPPYPVLVIMYLLAGFGIGLQDGAWNAWIGAMADANQILGFLHGLYGLGATVSPFIATAMITKANLPWYNFYYVMFAAAVFELPINVHAFWSRTANVFRDGQPPREVNTNGSRSSRIKQGSMYESLFKLPGARVTWLLAFFLFGYVGAEVAIGGWVVTFMLKERHGSPFESGMTETGFWLGVTVGRVVLGFVTPRIGEKLAIAIYLPLALTTTLLFWLIPSFVSSAIFVGFQGFFLGPLFPGAVVMATKLLPSHLHVSAIGFAAAFGGTGGAAFPFAVGAIAQKAGVEVLQPITVALMAVIWALWMGLPRLSKKRE